MFKLSVEKKYLTDKKSVTFLSTHHQKKYFNAKYFKIFTKSEDLFKIFQIFFNFRI